jgi:hypothetical protein
MLDSRNERGLGKGWVVDAGVIDMLMESGVGSGVVYMVRLLL